MIKNQLLILVLVLSVVSLATLKKQPKALAATSERSQVGIYFEEIVPDPPPSVKPPVKLPQTSNNQQAYLQVIGSLLLIALVYKGIMSCHLMKGGNE